MIKRLLTFLLVWIFLTVQASASGWLINSYRFAAVPSVPTITFLQCTEDGGAGPTFTFASQNVGTESSDRVTVVGVAVRDSVTGTTINSLTIGGTAATEITHQGATGVTDSSIYSLLNTTGTSETIEVIVSQSAGGLVICVWQMNNALSAAFAYLSLFDTDSGTISLNTNTIAEGVLVAICITNSISTTSWSAGLTERADEQLGGNTLAYTAADFDEDSTGATPLTITATVGGSADTTCSVASFGPIGSYPTLSFVGNVDDATDTATYTYTAAATGTAGGTRTTIVGACGVDGATNFSILSITVDSDGAGGAAPVSATEVVDTANTSAQVQCAIYTVANPNNTTATIVVTYSEPITGALISVWAAYDLNAITATDFATGYHASSSAFNVDTDVQANGIVVGVGETNGANNDAWTGLTERTYTAGAEGLSNINPADGTTTTAQVPRVITYNSGSANNPALAAVAAFK